MTYKKQIKLKVKKTQRKQVKTKEVIQKVNVKKINSALIISTILVIGCILADDLFTYFICFQMALIASYITLTKNVNERSIEAANSYLTFGMITGMVMLMGMFLITHEFGTTCFNEVGKNIQELTPLIIISLLLVLIGFGMNCGIILLHPWIDNVYKENDEAISLFFSNVVSKAGLIGIWKIGTAIQVEGWYNLLVVIGSLTALISLFKTYYAKKGKVKLAYINTAMTGLIIATIPYTTLSVILIVVQMVIITLLTQKVSFKDEEETNTFSLEKCIYRPIFLEIIPFIFAFLLRMCDKCIDSVVKFLRKTIFRDKRDYVWDKVGTPVTYICGSILDEIVHLLNKTVFRKAPTSICFVNELAYLKLGLNLTSKVIIRSVSFGLLMFCVGFCLTIGYLLLG